jgi:uncharacterized membrane protein
MSEDIRSVVRELIEAGYDSLTERERRVILRIARRHHVAQNANQAFDERLSVGDRLADKVAVIGGSWHFVIGFGVFLLIWVIANTAVLAYFDAQFDAYPYIFLNLILSMLAAIQAPIIMMSQNRQAAKDRLVSGLDYEVNLKAELEITGIHEKLDKLLSEKIDLMTEIHQEELALLRQISARQEQTT